MTILDSEIENLRVNYQKDELDEKSAHAHPLDLFKHWFGEAVQSKCDEPNAFTLSTIDAGRPRGRVVLFKGHHNEGIVFYTNYHSPKGHELKATPFASATFVWLPLQRQVRIEGRVQQLPEEMSDSYFAKRPYGSQIGAIASPQGKVVSSRQELEEAFKQTKNFFPEGKPVPRPKTWGGFALVPDRWEFWQGRQNRLHDRIVYLQENGAWVKKRLAP